MVIRSVGALLVAASVAALLGCSGPEDPPPDETELVGFTSADCPKIDVPTYAVVSEKVFSICVHCHASTNVGDARNGAPDGIDFDSYASAKASANLAVPMVRQRLMPYPDGSGLTNAARNRLYEWAICGTPP